jgi:prepilin signal peptidase PulO-like enzyme (type II secretory pathway)
MSLGSVKVSLARGSFLGLDWNFEVVRVLSWIGKGKNCLPRLFQMIVGGVEVFLAGGSFLGLGRNLEVVRVRISGERFLSGIEPELRNGSELRGGQCTFLDGKGQERPAEINPWPRLSQMILGEVKVFLARGSFHGFDRNLEVVKVLVTGERFPFLYTDTAADLPPSLDWGVGQVRRQQYNCSIAFQSQA